MADPLVELQTLYNEAIVTEITEKTKSNSITWGQSGTGIFQATLEQTQNTCPGEENSLGAPKDRIVTWNMQTQRIQIGVSSFRYNLDIRKDGVLWVSVENDGVQDLFNMVELIVLRLDAKIKETLQFVQNVDDGR